MGISFVLEASSRDHGGLVTFSHIDGVPRIWDFDPGRPWCCRLMMDGVMAVGQFSAYSMVGSKGYFFFLVPALSDVRTGTGRGTSDMPFPSMEKVTQYVS